MCKCTKAAEKREKSILLEPPSIPACTAAAVVVRRATRRRHLSTRWAVRQQETWLRKIKGFVSFHLYGFLFSLYVPFCAISLDAIDFFRCHKEYGKQIKTRKSENQFQQRAVNSPNEDSKAGEKKESRLSIGKQNVKCLRAAIIYALKNSKLEHTTAMQKR